MDDGINWMSLEGEFKNCPSCGYNDGFHNAFKKDGGSIKWLLICPACHKIFDIGLMATG